MKTQAAGYRVAIAVRYWKSAHIILKYQARPVQFMEPVAHLLAMAAELILKAYLTDAGLSDAQLSGKKVGHDLGSCLRLCIERGLAISEGEATCLLAMRVAHISTFNRYGPKSSGGNLALGAFEMADEQAALKRVAELIDRISGDPLKLRAADDPGSMPTDWPITLPPLRCVDLQILREIEARQRERSDYVASLNSKFVRDGLTPPSSK